MSTRDAPAPDASARDTSALNTPAPDAFAVNTPAPVPLRGHWFDGRSSQARAVHVVLRVEARGPSLVLHEIKDEAGAPTAGDPHTGSHTGSHTFPHTFPRSYAHHAVGWPEYYNPRRPPARLVVDLGRDGSLEILDPTAWHAALQASGYRPSLARRMQTRWPVLLAVLVGALLTLILFQRFGNPWLARQIARAAPLSWELKLADMALQQVDQANRPGSRDLTLAPSRLPPARQAALRARFDALVATIPPDLQPYPGYAPRYSLSFRQGSGEFARNAFALPGGAVVMSDGLVRWVERLGLGDEALVGVLAHELGHIVHRHGARSLAEHGVLGVVLSFATGDVSNLWAGASIVLSGFAYSRSHEREADCFALALLQHAHLPTKPTGDLFMRVWLSQTKLLKKRPAQADAMGAADTTQAPKTPAPARPRPGSNASVRQLFSTHPDLLARARQFINPSRPGYCEAR